MKVIVEGLTGTGKSSTIAAMRRLGLLPTFFVPEEDTLGEVWDELQATAPLDPRHLVRRLEAVLARLRTDSPTSFLLERFHLSYFALVPDWSYYEAIDNALVELGARLVLLTVPERHIRERSLFRREHGDSDWQGMIAHFGTEAAAVDALRTSQQRRLDALARTRLRTVTIDTHDADWDAYARRIAALV